MVGSILHLIWIIIVVILLVWVVKFAIGALSSAMYHDSKQEVQDSINIEKSSLTDTNLERSKLSEENPSKGDANQSNLKEINAKEIENKDALAEGSDMDSDDADRESLKDVIETAPIEASSSEFLLNVSKNHDNLMPTRLAINKN